MIKALNSVGLEAAFLDRLTLRLSEGQMQRVALSSAIVARPLLLALYDVTMQLDPRGKRELIEAMHALGEEHITTQLSDSQIQLLAESGDRFI
jgi:energy-coupling factor transport system ATP-binding protein